MPKGFSWVLSPIIFCKNNGCAMQDILNLLLGLMLNAFFLYFLLFDFQNVVTTLPEDSAEKRCWYGSFSNSNLIVPWFWCDEYCILVCRNKVICLFALSISPCTKMAIDTNKSARYNHWTNRKTMNDTLECNQFMAKIWHWLNLWHKADQLSRGN